MAIDGSIKMSLPTHENRISRAYLEDYPCG